MIKSEDIDHRLAVIGDMIFVLSEVEIPENPDELKWIKCKTVFDPERPARRNPGQSFEHLSPVKRLAAIYNQIVEDHTASINGLYAEWRAKNAPA